MMTNEQVKKYAEELRRFIGHPVAECSCEVKEITGDLPAIEIMPGELNPTNTLYHTKEIVDFCRGRGLTFWVGADVSDGHAYPYAHIY